jgi:hypothetical protein
MTGARTQVPHPAKKAKRFDTAVGSFQPRRLLGQLRHQPRTKSLLLLFFRKEVLSFIQTDRCDRIALWRELMRDGK